MERRKGGVGLGGAAAERHGLWDHRGVLDAIRIRDGDGLPPRFLEVAEDACVGHVEGTFVFAVVVFHSSPGPRKVRDPVGLRFCQEYLVSKGSLITLIDGVLGELSDHERQAHFDGFSPFSLNSRALRIVSPHVDAEHQVVLRIVLDELWAGGLKDVDVLPP